MSEQQYKAKKNEMNELGKMWLECDFEDLDWVEKRMDKIAQELERHAWNLKFYGENWA